MQLCPPSWTHLTTCHAITAAPLRFQPPSPSTPIHTPSGQTRPVHPYTLPGPGHHPNYAHTLPHTRLISHMRFNGNTPLAKISPDLVAYTSDHALCMQLGVILLDPYTLLVSAPFPRAPLQFNIYSDHVGSLQGLLRLLDRTLT